jgi:hypothetical protein
MRLLRHLPRKISILIGVALTAAGVLLRRRRSRAR